MSVNNRMAFRVPTEEVVSQFCRRVTANGVIELGWLPPGCVVVTTNGAGLGAGTVTFTYDSGPTGSPTGSVSANSVFQTQVRAIATVASLPANQVGFVYVTFIAYDTSKP